MNEAWGALAVGAGGVLVFLTTSWRLYQDHLPIRRLERLVEVRAGLADGTDPAADIDEAIAVLSRRLRISSYPLGRERLYAVGGGLAIYVVGIILVALEAAKPGGRSLVEQWPVLVLVFLGLVTAFVGSFAPRRGRA